MCGVCVKSDLAGAWSAASGTNNTVETMTGSSSHTRTARGDVTFRACVYAHISEVLTSVMCPPSTRYVWNRVLVASVRAGSDHQHDTMIARATSPRFLKARPNMHLSLYVY